MLETLLFTIMLPPDEMSPCEPGVEIWRRELSAEIANDPAAVALLGRQRMMDALCEALIAVPKTTRKTTPQFSTAKKGVFGRAKAFFYVIEMQGRKMIHWHAPNQRADGSYDVP